MRGSHFISSHMTFESACCVLPWQWGTSLQLRFLYLLLLLIPTEMPLSLRPYHMFIVKSVFFA